MFLPEGGDPVAAMESMLIHMDMRIRRTAPFRPEVMAVVDAIGEAHKGLPVPKWSGRRIAMPEPK
jgi:acyl-CoA thioester hydrolase